MIRDPLLPLRAINAILEGFFYGLRMSRRTDMNTTIKCSCGYVWIQYRPERYGGAAAYPQVCPGCGGAGRPSMQEGKTG